MKPTRAQIEKAARRYVKLVEWSEQDGCYLGSAPPLVGHSCHGRSEAEVLAQLSTIVEEWVTTLLSDGTPLPEASARREYSGRFIVRIPPETHRRAALKALARGESLNQFVSQALTRA